MKFTIALIIAAILGGLGAYLMYRIFSAIDDEFDKMYYELDRKHGGS